MKLTKQEISFLAKEFEDKSELSLFANINEALSGTEEVQLEVKGIYADGKITSKAKDFFAPFAYATSCTKVVIKDSYFIVEKYSYKYKDKLVIVENRNGELDLSQISNFEDLNDEFKEFFGQGLIKRSDVKVTLTPKELLVLLAAVDIARRDALADYIGERANNDKISLDSIYQQFVQDKKNSLAKMITANYGFEAPTKEEIESITKALVTKGCFMQTDKLQLANDYFLLAVNLLIPETIVTVETFKLMGQNEMMVASALILSAGIRDIVSMVIALEEVQLTSLSGVQLIDLLNNFISCPEID